MNHNVPSHKAACRLNPEACFRAGAPEHAISNRLGPRSTIEEPANRRRQPAGWNPSRS